MEQKELVGKIKEALIELDEETLGIGVINEEEQVDGSICLDFFGPVDLFVTKANSVIVRFRTSDPAEVAETMTELGRVLERSCFSIKEICFDLSAKTDNGGSEVIADGVNEDGEIIWQIG